MRPIPTHTVPLINPETGLVNAVWYEYLKALDTLAEPPPEMTAAELSALLDSSFGSTRGSLLVRGASAWDTIEPSADGKVLTDNGAGADPAFESLPTPTNIWKLISETSISSSAQWAATGLGSYRALRITGLNILPATDAVLLDMRLSSDNGSTYISTGYVVGATVATDRIPLIYNASAGYKISNSSSLGGATFCHTVFDFGSVQRTMVCPSGYSNAIYGRDGGGTYHTNGWYGYHDSQTAMNALKIYFSSGNIASGIIILEGMT